MRDLVVHTTVNLSGVDVEVTITHADIMDALRDAERPSDYLDPEAQAAAEAVFYHYYGKETPECLKQLIHLLTGRVL